MFVTKHLRARNNRDSHGGCHCASHVGRSEWAAPFDKNHRHYLFIFQENPEEIASLALV